MTDPSSDAIDVLTIVPTIDPEAGGPSQSTVNSVIAESGSCLRSLLVTTTHSSPTGELSRLIQSVEREGVKVALFPRLRSMHGRRGTWGVSPRLIFWIVRHLPKYDVVHLHYVWSLTTLVGAVRAHAANVPVVLTPHESLTRYDIDVTSGSTIKRRLKLAMRKLIMRRVTMVVCASDLELEDSLRTREPGIVIAHPVLPQPDFASKLPANDHFTFGFLGRIHPKKGIERLLRAIAELDENVNLIICGDGKREYVASLHDLAKQLEISARVDWRGHVDLEGKHELLRTIDWLVMPSDYECFGMSGAESIAAGVPVIVSSETGLASIAEQFDCGIVADLNEPASLTNALRHAVTLSPQETMRYRCNTVLARENVLSAKAYRRAIRSLYFDQLV